MRLNFCIYFALLCLLSFPSVLSANDSSLFSTEQPQKFLKKREPTWYPKVQAYFEDGSTKEVFFYGPGDQKSYVPVKRLVYHQNQRLALEEDLCWDSDAQQSKAHGISVQFWDTGSLHSFVFFHKGVKQGQTKYFYKNGKLKQEATYKENELHGPYISYYSNGQIEEKIHYLNGKKEGQYTLFDDRGNQLKEAIYIDGLLEGPFSSWYPGGTLASTHLFKKGLLQSNESSPACVKYRETGVISEVYNYHQGQLDGLCSEYYPSSKLSYRVVYQKGLKEGKEEYFSEKGEPLGGGEFKKGKPIKNHIIKYPSGLFKCIAIYDAKGQLLKPIEMFYPNGQKESVYSTDIQGEFDKEACTWHPNGEIASKAYYIHGKLEGKQVEYDEKSQLIHEAIFENGVMTHLKKWHPNGQLALESHKNPQGEGEGLFCSWYPEGQQEIECTYSKGHLNGEFKQWFENGQIKTHTFYVSGTLEGPFQEWFSTRQIKKEAFYKEGQLHSNLKQWFENGKIQLEAFYENGVKEGVEQTYYSNGKRRSKCSFKNGQMDGTCLSWFESGQLHLNIEYEKGIPHGDYYEYYPSEDKEALRPKQVLNYCQGRLDGEQKSFYANGCMEALLTYKESELNGKKAKWSEEGELLHESSYFMGQLDGRFYQKYPDHSEIIYHYKQNKRQGQHVIYYPHDPVLGSVKALEGYYENDLLEGEVSEYHEGGEKVASTFYHEGRKQGTSKVYNLKGGVIAEASYEQGVLHGPSLQYYPDGKIYKKMLFEKGSKEGVETTFFQNGEILSEYQYSQGKLDGYCFEKNRKGVLIFEAEYKQGQRHGIFNKFYEDGQPKVLQNFCEDQLHGIKKVYDKNQNLTEFNNELGTEIHPDD